MIDCYCGYKFKIKCIVTEEELQNLAENVRPNVEQAMKIDVAPWMEGYDVRMNELYSELSLEKRDSKAFGEERQKLENYKTLFYERENKPHKASKNTQANKILGKAEPGMGKTTLSKKIAYDWACGAFTRLSLYLLFSSSWCGRVSPLRV